MTAKTREAVAVEAGQETTEGAGVRLCRAFGRVDARLDPFLLLDDFGSEDPADYTAGFPWHPHRGIETITFMLQGQVSHGDSLGNKGVIGAGDVQWMTAGSGIIHEEMPLQSEELRGFQLWVNLPASQKMTRPRYQEIRSEAIAEAKLSRGVTARVVSGAVGDVRGPVEGTATAVEYLVVTMVQRCELVHSVPFGRNAFAYVLEGEAAFAAEGAVARDTVLFGDGDKVHVATGQAATRFLLVSATPLQEPVAWGGPIVMSTAQELEQAMTEYRQGTFIRGT